MEELVLRTEGVGPLLLACLAWTACTFPPAARAATGHVGASLCSADCKHVVDPPKSPSQQTEGEAKARGQAEAIEIQNAGDIQEQGKGDISAGGAKKVALRSSTTELSTSFSSGAAHQCSVGKGRDSINPKTVFSEGDSRPRGGPHMGRRANPRRG